MHFPANFDETKCEIALLAEHEACLAQEEAVVAENLARIRGQRDYLRRSIAQKANLLSLIHALPDELLAAILIIGWRDTPKKQPYLLLMASLTRRLRSVALSTALIWTDVDVESDSYSACEMLQLYLERSRQCLLRLSIAIPNPGDHGGLERLVCILSSHSARLTSLSISTAPSCVVAIILGVFPAGSCAPELTHLDIRTGSYQASYAYAGPRKHVSLFSSMFPALSDVRLHMKRPWRSTVLDISLADLSALELVGFRGPSRTVLVTAASQLQTLWIDWNTLHAADGSQPVALASLISLTYTFGSESARDAELFLLSRSITAPSLTALTVYRTPTDPVREVVDAVKRIDWQASYPSVEKIRVNYDARCYYVGGVPDALKSLFEVFSRIQSVHVTSKGDLRGEGAQCWCLALRGLSWAEQGFDPGWTRPKRLKDFEIRTLDPRGSDLVFLALWAIHPQVVLRVSESDLGAMKTLKRVWDGEVLNDFHFEVV